MGEFLAFLLVVAAIGWGSALALVHLRRFRDRLEPSADTELMASLLEDREQLEQRLSAVEDELGFLRELYGGKEPDQLPPPEAPAEGGGGEGVGGAGTGGGG